LRGVYMWCGGGKESGWGRSFTCNFHKPAVILCHHRWQLA
jgi:hypothetical protein